MRCLTFEQFPAHFVALSTPKLASVSSPCANGRSSQHLDRLSYFTSQCAHTGSDLCNHQRNGLTSNGDDQREPLLLVRSSSPVLIVIQWHQVLADLVSVLFTVSNLVISNAYPRDVQSLAGGVFNEVAQFGNSVGLAVTAAIAASVTEHVKLEDDAEALLKGYRAAFWTISAATIVVILTVFFGYRKAGLVGKKDD